MDKKKPDHSLQETNSYASESSTDELPGMESDTLSLAAHNAKAVPGSAPQRIQNYVLEDVLGQGGMGTVYRARQVKPIKREVALKVIKLGRDSKKVIARFNAERQAMALMNHPYIAKVLDAGLTETDSPFFVMELIDGKPIVDFCDRHNLSIKARLQLFEKVCRGMEHAHQRGIIHRDLKPSNILVTIVEGEAIPKIIDFGLAKATENIEPIAQTELTELGQVLGTVQYMSPEQAELGILDLDTRTDVYSLGVILFELITGSTPLDTETAKTRSLLELLEYIRAQEPIRPSDRIRAENRSESLPKSKSALARSQSVIGELDWIVVKAIERDRQRRYGSATQLAEDIERFLNHEPILAKPPSVAYRLQKFGRRYRTPLIVLALLFAIMFFGTAFSTYWAFRANTLAIEANNAAIEANNAAKESRLQSLYSQAESALNKGRYRDAFQFSSTAIKEGGDWEFGYQLKRIGDEVLKKRRLLASIPVDNEPLWVRFLTKDRIIFQTPSPTKGGYEVISYDISKSKVLSRRSVVSEWKYPAFCAEKFIAIVEGNRVKLIHFDTLNELAARELSGEILEMKVSQNQNRLAVLTENANATVFDAQDLKQIGKKELKFNGNERIFLISPNGNKLVLKTDFIRHQLWSLDTGQLSEQQIPSGHLLEFTGIENQLFGITYEGPFANGVTLANCTWTERGLEKFGNFRRVRGLNAVGQLQSIAVRKGTGIEDLQVACFYEKHVDIFSAGDYLNGINTRYVDLFPTAIGATKILGHSFDDSQLALYAGGKICCVELRRRDGWNVDLALNRNVLADRVTPAYKMFNQSQLYSLTGTNQLSIFNIITKQTRTKNLKSIFGSGQRIWEARIASPSADGTKLAALWQESDSGGASARYFNRKIAVYDLVDAATGETCETEMQFDADFMEYSKSISWARLAFAAGNKTLLVTSWSADQTLRLDLLNIASGRITHSLNANDSVGISPSGQLFATSSRNKVEVRSTNDASIVHSFPHDGVATGIAFAPDDSSLFVGTNQNSLVEFSLTTGQRSRTVPTAIAPLLIFPESNFYLGSKQEGRDFMGIPFGPLHLASLDNGLRIETLAPRFSKLSPLAISDNQQFIIGLPFLIESISVDTLSRTLNTPRLRSTEWTQLHVDGWAASDRAKRLVAAALEALGTAQFNSKVKELESYIFVSGDTSLLMELRDLYARCLDWEQALRVHEQAADALPRIQGYYKLMILFKLGRHAEFKTLRAELLNNLEDDIPNHEINMRLIATCLQPLDDENERGIKRLAEQAKSCHQQWERNKYADVLYRLGQYLPWHSSTKEPGIHRKPLLNAAARFTQNPTERNRESLQAQHDQLEKTVKEFEVTGRLSNYWHNEIREYGYLWEAKRLLGLLNDHHE